MVNATVLGLGYHSQLLSKQARFALGFPLVERNAKTGTGSAGTSDKLILTRLKFYSNGIEWLPQQLECYLKCRLSLPIDQTFTTVGAKHLPGVHHLHPANRCRHTKAQTKETSVTVKVTRNENH